MEKTYNPQSIEQKWYSIWEDQGYFEPRQGKDTFCIMIPPPNVTGSLHMGHAFQDTIMDTLVRFNRMCGKDTLWQAGTDHAGIATQMVVERQLNADGKTRHDLGREAFLDRVWKWKSESGGTITQQLRRMGASLDWSRERFTMDEGLSKAVNEVFVRLYNEDLIYRGKRLVNWDPVLHTAVSDLEVLSDEEDGHMWHIRYPIVGQSEYLIVATTRPETMLGDAAVAVHPEDSRYTHLVGQQLELPLTGRTIPIIQDEHVDPEFGTGCVKITPAHDFNDYEVWMRHRDSDALATLPNRGLINIFTIDARIITTEDEHGELIPTEYQNLDRYQARKSIVADLEKQQLLEKTVKHKLTVPRGDRSGAVIEPLLTNQWYVRAAPLAEPAVKAVETGQIRFVPDNWKNTYYEWMRNIQDWCISRQIWWGHRIPAWYDDQGKLYVGHSEAEVRKQHNLGDQIPLRQDEDVLDTWFSSALWPFSTLGWPEKTAALEHYYPTSVLVTGFDIIFFWVARMIMMGLKFMGDVPFKEIYIHGLVRDAHGQKMSKSKGNVLDPIDLIDGIELDALIEKRTTGLMQPHMKDKIKKSTKEDFPNGIPAFGTDALRFTFAALASTGRGINFDLNRIEGYRNYCNKLWNAARYVLMNTEDKDCGLKDATKNLTVVDRWILSRLQDLIENVRDSIGQYRLDLAAQAIYEFTWSEYCDWYLELSKPVLTSADTDADTVRATRHTLVQVLETLLRLAHPFVPYISEEIWQRVAPLAGVQGDTIMLQSYPVAQSSSQDNAACEEIQWIKDFILGVRKIRSGMNIKPGKPLSILLDNGVDQDHRYLDNNLALLKSLGRIEDVSWLEQDEQAPESATALVGKMKILIPMAGLIDKEAEKQRLGKELDKLNNERQRCGVKLANPNFVDRAPAQVVEKERTRLNEIEQSIAQLSEQLNRIEAI